MARATLEMFLKLTGADKTSKGLDKTSNAAKNLDDNVKNSAKSNAQFSAGMSGLTKGAIAGAALLAGKALVDFAADALEAAVSAEEAAAAFETTFGDAVVGVTKFTEEFANKAGLTTSELQQLLATTGSVAQGIGFTQEESADLGETLTRVAADVASFSNVQGGAEPVLRAFQSALLGENEALKTYGLAISASEVETKAFEMTGKSTSNSLTRQEKALATLAVIQQKAAVQIGDLDRTSESFANQQRLVQAEVRQLSEDIGAELIPAAAEILPIFRELVNDVAPPTIEFFKTTAQFVADLALAFDNLALKAEFVSNQFPRLSANGERFLNFLKRISPVFAFIRSIQNLAEEQREFNIASDDTAEKIIAQQIAQGLANKEAERARQTTLKQTVQTSKLADTIDKKLNPIFGEQNSLILTNIQLETDRKKLLDLITNANTDLAQAQKARNQAAKEVNELQIQENVNDAQAAIRKSELLTQISLLTQAQANGVDVTNELNLANAELAEAEFELANDSDRLTLAKERLLIADENLKKATENQEQAIKSRNDALLESIDLTKQQEDANKKIIDQQALFQQFRAFETAPITPISAPVLTPSNDTSTGGTGTQEIVIQSNLILDDSVLATEIQKVNTKTQQQGKTFLIDRLR